jgi:hypothetical protein
MLGASGTCWWGWVKKSPRRSSEGLKDDVRIDPGIAKIAVQVEEDRKPLMAIVDYKECFIPVRMAWNQSQERSGDEDDSR